MSLGANKSHFADEEPKKYFTTKLSVFVVNKEKSMSFENKICTNKIFYTKPGSPNIYRKHIGEYFKNQCMSILDYNFIDEDVIS